MICPRCGALNPDSASVCSRCDASLYGGQPSASAPQPPAYQQPPVYNGGQSPASQGPLPQAYLQPVQYEYPNQQPPYDQAQKQPANTSATISFVCGVIGFFLFGVILGAIAVMQGYSARRFGYTGWKATTGIILGAIDIVACILIIVRFLL